jgi:hypothetical protein
MARRAGGQRSSATARAMRACPQTLLQHSVRLKCSDHSDSSDSSFRSCVGAPGPPVRVRRSFLRFLLYKPAPLRWRRLDRYTKPVKRVGPSRRPVFLFILCLHVPHLSVVSCGGTVRTQDTHTCHITTITIGIALPRDCLETASRPAERRDGEPRETGEKLPIRYFFGTTRAETPRSACRRATATRASRVSRLRLAPRVARRRRASPRPSERRRTVRCRGVTRSFAYIDRYTTAAIRFAPVPHTTQYG